VKQAVECRKIVTINVKQVVSLARHRPGACDLGLSVDHPGKAGGLIGAVSAQMNLNEALNLQAEFQRIQTGRVAGDIALSLKALTAAACLAGREVQQLTQLMRGQMRILLQR